MRDIRLYSIDSKVRFVQTWVECSVLDYSVYALRGLLLRVLCIVEKGCVTLSLVMDDVKPSHPPTNATRLLASMHRSHCTVRSSTVFAATPLHYRLKRIKKGGPKLAR